MLLLLKMWLGLSLFLYNWDDSYYIERSWDLCNMFDSQSSFTFIRSIWSSDCIGFRTNSLFWNSGRDNGIFQSDSYAITEFWFYCLYVNDMIPILAAMFDTTHLSYSQPVTEIQKENDLQLLSHLYRYHFVLSPIQTFYKQTTEWYTDSRRRKSSSSFVYTDSNPS